MQGSQVLTGEKPLQLVAVGKTKIWVWEARQVAKWKGEGQRDCFHREDVAVESSVGDQCGDGAGKAGARSLWWQRQGSQLQWEVTYDVLIGDDFRTEKLEMFMR